LRDILPWVLSSLENMPLCIVRPLSLPLSWNHYLSWIRKYLMKSFLCLRRKLVFLPGTWLFFGRRFGFDLSLLHQKKKKIIEFLAVKRSRRLTKLRVLPKKSSKSQLWRGGVVAFFSLISRATKKTRFPPWPFWRTTNPKVSIWSADFIVFHGGRWINQYFESLRARIFDRNYIMCHAESFGTLKVLSIFFLFSSVL
jgi:hypothetical protein